VGGEKIGVNHTRDALLKRMVRLAIAGDQIAVKLVARGASANTSVRPPTKGMLDVSSLSPHKEMAIFRNLKRYDPTIPPVLRRELTPRCLRRQVSAPPIGGALKQKTLWRCSRTTVDVGPPNHFAIVSGSPHWGQKRLWKSTPEPAR